SKYVTTRAKDLNLESKEVSLLDASACGAFIHGLEDEFVAVRLAGVDMFNDEMLAPRLASLHALQQVSTKYDVVVGDDRVETVCMVLHDADANVRAESYKLFGLVTFDSKATLETLLEQLRHNLVRFPGDVDMVYECARRVGGKNCGLVDKHLIDKLLKIDRRFLPREIAIEDREHIANLVLILSAIQRLPNEQMREVVKLLPEYVKWQALYLKGKMEGRIDVEAFSADAVADADGMDLDSETSPAPADLESTYLAHLAEEMDDIISWSSAVGNQDDFSAEVSDLEKLIGDVKALMRKMDASSRDAFGRKDSAAFLHDFGSLVLQILQIKNTPIAPRILHHLQRIASCMVWLAYKMKGFYGGGNDVESTCGKALWLGRLVWWLAKARGQGASAQGMDVEGVNESDWGKRVEVFLENEPALSESNVQAVAGLIQVFFRLARCR
ncbi:Integrator complex subunit 4, partial [Rhizophlyctis rosea]